MNAINPSANDSPHHEKVSDQELKALVRERFTKTAEVFGDYAVAQRVAEAELLARLVAAGPGDVAVDLACGPGTLALRFAKHVRWICAYDLTPVILMRARQTAAQEGLLKKLDCAIGDAQVLPFADGSLDLAVTSYSLHHISDPARVIREMARVLKRGGRVGLIDIVVPEDPKVRELNHRIEWIRDHSHCRSLSRAEFKSMMEAAGLRITATETREHPRTFDHWMHVGGWKRSDAEYIEARSLLVASMEKDGSNFHPRFEPAGVTRPGAEPELYMTNTGIYIAAEKF
ncbi:MAG: methyltransferase domain-containing protein [Candidatus Acidiferrales bacterium]